jgi:hypothetical protein
VLVFPLPILLIGVAYALQSPTLPIAAFVVQYIGLMAERWYFFAEASIRRTSTIRALGTSALGDWFLQIGRDLGLMGSLVWPESGRPRTLIAWGIDHGLGTETLRTTDRDDG